MPGQRREIGRMQKVGERWGKTGIEKSSNEPSRFISDSANRFPRFFEKIGGQGVQRLLIGIWSIHPSMVTAWTREGWAIMARDRSKNTPDGARFVLESFSKRRGFSSCVSPLTVANYCVRNIDEVFVVAFSRAKCVKIVC